MTPDERAYRLDEVGRLLDRNDAARKKIFDLCYSGVIEDDTLETLLAGLEALSYAHRRAYRDLEATQEGVES